MKQGRWSVRRNLPQDVLPREFDDHHRHQIDSARPDRRRPLRILHVASDDTHAGELWQDRRRHAASTRATLTASTPTHPLLPGVATSACSDVDGTCTSLPTMASWSAAPRPRAATRTPSSWTQAGGIHDLGSLGGSYSEAFDVNDAGLVVGAASDASGGVTYAVVWDLNGTFDPDLPPVIEPVGSQSAVRNTTLTVTPSISDPEGDAWTVTWSPHGLELPTAVRSSRDRLPLRPWRDAGRRQLRMDAG